MKAIQILSPGGPEVMNLVDLPDPVAGDGELLVRVKTTALNGADLLQRRGLYPPPKGASEILGLEVAGEVIAVGKNGSGPDSFKVGDRVMALLSGGGYAEKVVIPSGLAMRIPEHLTDEQAGAIPEAFLTAYLELIWLGELKRGESLLIHAGASGVGTAAIQIAREVGARILVTASSITKLEKCKKLGADVGIDYKTESFDDRILAETSGIGVNCVLDLVGAVHWKKTARSLALDGRWLLVGLGGGAQAEVDLRQILNRRLKIIGSTLRSRSDEQKIKLTREFADFALPLFAKGALVPVIDRTFPLSEVAEAHRYLESQKNIGKVVLKVY